jgi:hypothetical protein
MVVAVVEKEEQELLVQQEPVETEELEFQLVLHIQEHQ